MRDPATYFQPLAEECQRYAVAAAYDVPFDSTPAIAGLTPLEAAYAWTRWATKHRLRWWRSKCVAPIGLPRWLARVDFRGQPHQIVMSHDRFYCDTTGNVRNAALDQVEVAEWLLPADQSLKGMGLAPINGAAIEAGGANVIARRMAEPGEVNQTMLVYTADRPPQPVQGPNRAARRAARRRRR